MTYEPISQFVCVPNPPVKDLKGPAPMLIKVKNKELAEELVRKVEDLAKA